MELFGGAELLAICLLAIGQTIAIIWIDYQWFVYFV
jgi:hypothetical protein